ARRFGTRKTSMYSHRRALMWHAPLALAAAMCVGCGEASDESSPYWGKTIDANGAQYVSLVALNEDILVTAPFYQPMTLGDQELHPGANSSFIARVDPFGRIVWGKAIAGALVSYIGAVDGENVYVTGTHIGPLSIGDESHSS